MRTLLSRHWRSAVIGLGAFALVLGVLVASPWKQTQVNQAGLGAWAFPVGKPTSEIHLIDTGESGVACPLNVPTGVQNVANDGSSSFLWDSQAVYPLGSEQCKLGTAIKGLPGGIDDAVIGGPTMAVSTSKGAYRLSTDGKSNATLAVGKITNPAVGVGADGTVAVASSGSVAVLSPFATKPVASGVSTHDCKASTCKVSVVDGHPVVLQTKSNVLSFDNGNSVTVSHNALLGSGAAGASVPVVSGSGLTSYDDGGSSLWTVPVSQKGALPIATTADGSGCSYGAFLVGNGVTLVRHCGTGDETTSAVVPSSSNGCDPGQLNDHNPSDWSFQSSAQSAVLSASNGDAYLLVGDSATCEHWQSLLKSTTANTSTRPRTIDNNQHHITCDPPTFYWQSGLSTPPVWPAVDTCHDDAGYPLFVSSIAQGTQYQVGPGGNTITPTSSSTAPSAGQVSYDVTDGSAGATQTVEATVSTDIAAAPGPQQRQAARTVYLGVDGTYTYNVLNDWYTMLGTPLSVASATLSTPSSTEVHVSDNGSIVISNYSGQPASVQVTVEDAMARTASYVIPIESIAQSSPAPPVVHDLSVEAQAGVATTSSLLSGDIDPSGGQLEVSSWGQVAGGQGCPSVPDGTPSIVCTFQNPGTYVYAYLVKSSLTNQATPAFIHFNVVEAAGWRAQSVAVDIPDIVGGQVTADLLAPEVAKGLHVAVSRFSCSSQIACQLFDGRYLHVGYQGNGSLTPFQVPFTVTDGSNSSDADLWITPRLVAANSPPQLASVGLQSVPAGGVLKVPVLVDAYSPIGAPLAVVSATTLSSTGCGNVAVWTDGSSVYVAASPTATSINCGVSYQVQETLGTTPATATSNFVVQLEPTPTQATLPNLDLRVFGTTGSVALPLGGATQDSAQTASIVDALLPVSVGTPNCGSATFSSDSADINYVASANSNCTTDNFAYYMRTLGGVVLKGNVNVVGIDRNPGACPAATAMPLTRYVPESQSSLTINLASSLSDPCGRTIVIGRVLAAPACLTHQLAGAASQQTIEIGNLTSCTTKDLSFTYQFSAGGSTLGQGEVTIVRGGVAVSQLSVRNDLLPLAPSSQIDLENLVAGNAGPIRFKVISGACQLSGSVLSAPSNPSSSLITPCAFQATDQSTGASAGGMVWLAGKTPLVEQNVTSQVVVPPGSSDFSVDIVGGKKPYFSAVPAVPLSISSVAWAGGCGRASQPMNGGDGSVKLNSPSAGASLTCSLEVNLIVNGSSAAQTFFVSVLFEGSTPPNWASCALPTLYPGVSASWDVSKCVDPGGYALSSLTFGATSDTGGVAASISQRSGENAGVSLTPDANTTGVTAHVTITVDYGASSLTPKTFALTVSQLRCNLSPADSPAVIKAGAAQTVAPIITVVGENCGGWQLSKVAVASESGVQQPSVGISSSNSQEISIGAISQSTAGLVGNIQISYVAVLSKDSTVLTNGTQTVTVNGPPGSPGVPQATMGVAVAALTWTSPTDTGGLPITSYSLTSNPPGGNCQVTSSPTAGQQEGTCGGLANNTPYSFSVFASNSAGKGPASTSAGAPTAGVPGAPGSLQLTMGVGRAGLTWSSPSNTGGTKITGYNITIDPQDQGATCQVSTPDPTVSQQSATCSGLTNNKQYTFTVFAVNAVGRSATGLSSSGSTATTPGVPTITQVTTDNGQTDIQWNAPSSGGSSITSYSLTVSPKDGTCQVTTSDLTASVQDGVCSGLSARTVYTFSVVASNAVGPGGSVTADSLPEPTVTSAIYDATSGNVTVGLDLGSANLPSSLTLDIQYSTSISGATWTNISTVCSPSSSGGNSYNCVGTLPGAGTYYVDMIVGVSLNSAKSAPYSQSIVVPSTPPTTAPSS